LRGESCETAGALRPRVALGAMTGAGADAEALGTGGLRVRVAGLAGSLTAVFSVAAGSLFLVVGAFFTGTGALRTLDVALGASSTAGSSATTGF